MIDDNLITLHEWNTKLRELRVANERIAELERQRAAWMAQQEPVGELVDVGDDTHTLICEWTELRYQLSAGTKFYAAPVAKPSAQDCVSVPKDKLKLAIEFMQFAQDVPLQERRATELADELRTMLAAAPNAADQALRSPTEKTETSSTPSSAANEQQENGRDGVDSPRAAGDRPLAGVSSAVPAAAPDVERDEWRTCEFCGCRTTAKRRACCSKGKAWDDGASRARAAIEKEGKK